MIGAFLYCSSFVDPDQKMSDKQMMLLVILCGPFIWLVSIAFYIWSALGD